MQDGRETAATTTGDGNAPMIPGAREARGLTRFAPLRESVADGNTLMDAATIAERQREGGGSPKEGRRRAAAL